MRTLILVVFTVFALSLGYMAYWFSQPVDRMKVRKPAGGDAPALELAKRETDRPYGPGKNVWVKKFDEHTAKLASRFRAGDYAPRRDGWMVVTRPQAQFFMKDGRAISVEGERGEVIMDDGHKKGMAALGGTRDTPSRGRLFGVTVKLYHDIARPEEQLDDEFVASGSRKAPKPALTITLNNASFDNQTFKIYSEGYGKGKGHVAADQVPVVLKGDDYDFYGRGMVIRWNERDRRLQLLEIAHGEKLIIKRPSAFTAKAEPSVAELDLEEVGRAWGPLPVMLAAKAKSAAAEAIVAAPTTRRVRGVVPKPKVTPSADPPLYRAVFHDEVHIVQGTDVDVTAQRMSVDFLMKDQEGEDDDGDEKGAATQPAKQRSPKRRAADEAAAATRPVATQAAATTQHVAATGPTTRAVARRKKRAATQPAAPVEPETPIEITWTGKLVVEPLVAGRETPIKAGEAVVRLEGQPVIAKQQGSTIEAGMLTYRTEDQAMLLAPVSAERPVVMRDDRGSVVKTTRMDFYQPKRQAVLYGTSDAVFPQTDEAGRPAAPLLAKWTKQCVLYFAAAEPGQAKGKPGGSAGAGEMNVERAELDGDVAVDHPQLKMRSQSLAMHFDTTRKSAAGGAAGGATTLPTVVERSPKARELDGQMAAVARELARVEAEAGKLPKGAAEDHEEALQESLEGLRALEEKLVAASQAVQALEEAGRAVPADVAKQFADARQVHDAEKARFVEMQRAIVRAQDLRAQREGLVKKQGELSKLLADAGGPASRPAKGGATTKPAIRSDLRSLVATGAVHCEMIDGGKPGQTIDCNRLTMQTATGPDGRLYPSTINADGEVRAVDAEQDLRAGHLAVTLRPSTRPASKGAATRPAAGEGSLAGGAVELQSMVAHQNVIVLSKDGTKATADQLLVDSKDGKNNLKLLGQPYATIVDKKSTVAGPIIEIFPDAQRLEVVGAGKMTGVQEDKAGGAERPLDVTWGRGLSFDGKANTVDVVGRVAAETTDADGARNTATGERVRMVLVDAAPPTTKPVTKPVVAGAEASAKPQAAGGAATKPAKSPSSGMASKTVRSISFEENATVSSVTLGADGSLLRRTHLEAATVQYDLLAKRMVVPVEGRMIVEDHRPAATQPATGEGARPAGGAVGDPAGNNRGSTGFKWTKRFTYDDTTRLAVMEGDASRPVIVAHKDDSPKGQVFQLLGETVTAELEEAAGILKGDAATKPATRPTEANVQLKRVTAEGRLVFTGPGSEIRALWMEFDPKTHWLVARGSERELVDFNISSQPGGAKTAEEVRYNTESGQVMAKRPTVRMGR